MAQGPRTRAQELGLVYNSPTWIANTKSAHRLAQYAMEESRLEDMHRALYHAYFVDGRNLGDEEVLADLAAGVGLDREIALEKIRSGAYEDRLQQARELAQEYGVTAVPAFIVAGRYKIVGAQPYEALLDALLRIQEESQ